MIRGSNGVYTPWGQRPRRILWKTIRSCELCDRFYKKGASGAKHQIRTAAPHFEMGLGHEWANFNTQSVQTLKFSRFVASRGSANHDGWHGFSKFYETPSDSVIYLIYFTKKVLPEQNIRSAQQRLILKWVWGLGGPNSTHNLCKHWVVHVLWPREAVQITMTGMDLASFMKNHQIS